MARGPVTPPVPVTLISSHAKAGGAERYVLNLLDGLGPGWVRRVVVLEDGPLVERLRAAGAPVEVIPTSARLPGILRSAWKLRRRLSRSDVVHANGIKAALVAAIATTGRRTPIVWVKHDFSFDGLLARLVAGRCRQVIGVSAAVTETFRRAPRGKIHVVHNGIVPPVVDRGVARAQLVAAIGPPAPAVAVALVGRFDPIKGHRELLAIAPKLTRAVPGLRLVLIGGESPSHPGYADELRHEIAAAGLEDDVAMLGHREDAVELIAGCDLALVPTVVGARGMGREGFSYVALEAMAVGTPVVGYANGALPETLGGCGIVVRPGDRAALRDAILQVLEDRALWERLARCGRQRATTNFSLASMVEGLKGRYREAAKAVPSRSGGTWQ